jgi:hypothetical protein
MTSEIVRMSQAGDLISSSRSAYPKVARFSKLHALLSADDAAAAGATKATQTVASASVVFFMGWILRVCRPDSQPPCKGSSSVNCADGGPLGLVPVGL